MKRIIPKSGKPICKDTKKRCFQSHESALIHGGKFLHQYGNKFFRSYKCLHCGSWHLTTH